MSPKVLFLISACALLLACGVFALMMSNMGSGRHMGAAVLAGIALPIIGVLAAGTTITGLAWAWQHSKAAAVALGLAAAAVAVVALGPKALRRAIAGRRTAEQRETFDSFRSLDDRSLAEALSGIERWFPDQNERCNALSLAFEKRACLDAVDPELMRRLIRAMVECTREPLPGVLTGDVCNVTEAAWWRAVEPALWPPNPSWDKREYAGALLDLDRSGGLMQRVLSQSPAAERAAWDEVARAAFRKE